MVTVSKAKNSDGYCCSCLDNKPHKRLYRFEIKTYGCTTKFHMCEICVKDMDNGIHSPEERVEEDDGWPKE